MDDIMWYLDIFCIYFILVFSSICAVTNGHTLLFVVMFYSTLCRNHRFLIAL